MAGGLLFALSLLVSAACAALSWEHVRRLRRTISIEPDTLVPRLKRLPIEGRMEELGRQAPEGSWERRLATDWESASDEPARVAVLNDALRELEHEMDASQSWPPAGIRLAAFATLLLALIAWRVDGTRWLVPIGVVGALGVGLSVLAVDQSKRERSARRTSVDALVDVLVGQRPAGAARTPRRPRRR